MKQIEKMACKYCSEPESNGDYDPCCNNGSGLCEAAWYDEGRSNCIHCGSEMFEEDGHWYHHTQEELTKDKRYQEHLQQSRRNF